MLDLRSFVENLAKTSGQIIMQYYQTQVQVEAKTDGSPVTEADKRAEEAMRDLINQHFPSHGVIGEEFGVDQPHASYKWSLDPIDGTVNFIAGVPLFGTLISLIHNNRPIIGAIHLPALGQLLIGIDGETLLNGVPVIVRGCERIEDAVVLATSHWGAEQERDMDAFSALTRRARLYRTWGDCYGYSLLATARADVMLDPKMALWDTAPLIPIIEGAGGQITDWYGNPATEGDSVVATVGGKLHDAVIRALNP